VLEVAQRLVALAQDLTTKYALGDISDVDLQSAAPTNGQALIYNGTKKLWSPGTAGGGSGVQSAFRMWRNAPAGWPAPGAPGQITYDTLEYDELGEVPGSGSPTTYSVFTPQASGLYCFAAAVWCTDAVASGQVMQLLLYDNTAAASAALLHQRVGTGVANVGLAGSAIVECTAGHDYCIQFTDGSPGPNLYGRTDIFYYAGFRVR
jgi:hypothetical protein